MFYGRLEGVYLLEFPEQISTVVKDKCCPVLNDVIVREGFRITEDNRFQIKSTYDKRVVTHCPTETSIFSGTWVLGPIVLSLIDLVTTKVHFSVVVYVFVSCTMCTEVDLHCTQWRQVKISWFYWVHWFRFRLYRLFITGGVLLG